MWRAGEEVGVGVTITSDFKSEIFFLRLRAAVSSSSSVCSWGFQSGWTKTFISPSLQLGFTIKKIGITILALCIEQSKQIILVFFQSGQNPSSIKNTPR